MSVEKQKVFWELLSWSKEDLTELKKELEKRKELKKKDLEEKEC